MKPTSYCTLLAEISGNLAVMALVSFEYLTHLALILSLQFNSTPKSKPHQQIEFQLMNYDTNYIDLRLIVSIARTWEDRRVGLIAGIDAGGRWAVLEWECGFRGSKRQCAWKNRRDRDVCALQLCCPRWDNITPRGTLPFYTLALAFDSWLPPERVLILCAPLQIKGLSSNWILIEIWENSH